ncbi:hypothetical protein BXZ70DRAFT_916248 [Cristinia sonorae]|uniref:Late embryogenesis abundant protein LEA-2 subgroup domain-containing protein n=1 Tax=Cristinia sonorae TaxID=1940300 RepID=A0A8K0XU93_9AGAR|nr:hypothetical protein BXZ70DRAFT_916248 [Cristinia sonorae]
MTSAPSFPLCAGRYCYPSHLHPEHRFNVLRPHYQAWHSTMASYGHNADHQEHYNPYDNAQPHQSYDQSGYHDAAAYGGGYRDEPINRNKERERSVFEDTPDVSHKEAKTAKALRQWRYEHQGNLWKRGGGARCCGRFFCCTIMIFVFLFLSIVLSLALWIKPPNVIVDTPVLRDNGSGSPVQLTADGEGLIVNLGINVSVSNPNYFSVMFNSLKADIFYPLNNTHIGNSSLKDINIKSNEVTNFTVPIQFNYDIGQDPKLTIIEDIASRCGFGGNGVSQLTVDYKIKVDFTALFIPIKPTISNSATFACPFTKEDIDELLKSVGLGGLSDLIPLLNALFSDG